MNKGLNYNIFQRTINIKIYMLQLKLINSKLLEPIFIRKEHMAFIRYFIAVPRIILNDQTCSQTDKLVYGVINSLSNNKEYCYASNSYFANTLSVKEKTISNSINYLKRKKYIDVKFVKRTTKNLS